MQVRMSNGPWTDDENVLIVADYFTMLVNECANRKYNKAEHIRKLRFPDLTPVLVKLKLVKFHPILPVHIERLHIL